jgi:hypothetical protein
MYSINDYLIDFADRYKHKIMKRTIMYIENKK